MKYSGQRKLLCELSKLSNLMLLTSSDTKRTLMHLFLFTNFAQRELVSICTHSIHDRNKLSLHYTLDLHIILFILTKCKIISPSFYKKRTYKSPKPLFWRKKIEFLKIF